MVTVVQPGMTPHSGHENMYIASQDDGQVHIEHVQNNQGVRDLLGRRGIKPEDLPPEEDVKKLRRKVEGDKKRLQKEARGFGRNIEG